LEDSEKACKLQLFASVIPSLRIWDRNVPPASERCAHVSVCKVSELRR